MNFREISKVKQEIRSLFQDSLGYPTSIREIFKLAASKGASVHIAKNRIIMEGSMQTTITATILGLTAQIEREFISTRTKEALAKRKSNELKLGRPKGQSQMLKLDNDVGLKAYFMD